MERIPKECSFKKNSILPIKKKIIRNIKLTKTLKTILRFWKVKRMRLIKIILI